MPVKSKNLVSGKDKQNFRTEERSCLHCKKEIRLNNNRDLKRKKFCSHFCRDQKSKAPIINKNCLHCKVDFLVSAKYKYRKYCSKNCFYTDVHKEARKRREKCLELAKLGMTQKEIAIELDMPPGTIGSMLNKSKYRKYAEGGYSYTAFIKRFKKGKICEICGFSRVTEAAHIVPVAEGGNNSENNLLVLCPNHHHLYDAFALTKEEAEKISYKDSNWKKRVKNECKK